MVRDFRKGIIFLQQFFLCAKNAFQHYAVSGIPNVIQKLVLAKLAPRILIRRSRRTNSSLLEIGGYFCGSKG
jgi:hypothetical protein